VARVAAGERVDARAGLATGDEVGAHSALSSSPPPFYGVGGARPASISSYRAREEQLRGWTGRARGELGSMAAWAEEVVAGRSAGDGGEATDGSLARAGQWLALLLLCMLCFMVSS